MAGGRGAVGVGEERPAGEQALEVWRANSGSASDHPVVEIVNRDEKDVGPTGGDLCRSVGESEDAGETDGRKDSESRRGHGKLVDSKNARISRRRENFPDDRGVAGAFQRMKTVRKFSRCHTLESVCHAAMNTTI